jgi:hypothetical protein
MPKTLGCIPAKKRKSGHEIARRYALLINSPTDGVYPTLLK